MRVQVIYNSDNKVKHSNLIWLEDLINSRAREYGNQTIEFLVNYPVDNSFDVIFKVINSRTVQIGFLNDLHYKANSDYQYHWVEIESIDKVQNHVLPQLILVTIAMQYLQSVTGSFSSDWEDIKAVLSRGGKGYCCAIEWSDSELLIQQLNSIQNESPFNKMLSCSMLINQNLGLSQTFQNLERIVNGIHHSEQLLSIVNITRYEELPSINYLLFISSEFNCNHNEQLTIH